MEQQLLELCRAFIAKQKIICAESIYQMDNVMENAPEFLESICALVGYDRSESED